MPAVHGLAECLPLAEPFIDVAGYGALAFGGAGFGGAVGFGAVVVSQAARRCWTATSTAALQSHHWAAARRTILGWMALTNGAGAEVPCTPRLNCAHG